MVTAIGTENSTEGKLTDEWKRRGELKEKKKWMRQRRVDLAKKWAGECLARKVKRFNDAKVGFLTGEFVGSHRVKKTAQRAPLG
jgi:hypothetical protein